ncbi:hypothetical protein [Acidobacterium sp. S8]|uniref:hypothetical protein n=1 Tax=Acidobacterium sp. S8 TaxID=1641854 RepID=UPI00131E0268|nr:hypothetical protein [Acidobacterium sp. S8]
MPVPARNHQNHKALQPVPLPDTQTALEIQEPFAAIAHDARNVVAALQIYSDLLAEPGVLSDGYRHFASDLRTIVASSSGLVQKLTMLSGPDKSLPQGTEIDDLPLAVERMKGPLSALAGQNIALEMECLPAYGRIRLSEEDLARILINLTHAAIGGTRAAGDSWSPKAAAGR